MATAGFFYDDGDPAHVQRRAYSPLSTPVSPVLSLGARLARQALEEDYPDQSAGQGRRYSPVQIAGFGSTASRASAGQPWPEEAFYPASYLRRAFSPLGLVVVATGPNTGGRQSWPSEETDLQQKRRYAPLTAAVAPAGNAFAARGPLAYVGQFDEIDLYVFNRARRAFAPSVSPPPPPPPTGYFGRAAQDLVLRLETGAPLYQEGGGTIDEEPLIFSGASSWVVAAAFYGRQAEDLVIREETGAPLSEESGQTIDQEPLIFSGGSASIVVAALFGRASEDLTLRQETGAPITEQDGVTPIEEEPLIFMGKTAAEEG